LQVAYAGGMTVYVALLRAVNVGGTGSLPMAELRAMAEAAGLGDVRSYIQSGNLLCSSPDGAGAVRAALEARLEARAGRPVGVTVRSADEMHRILGANPFPDADPARVGVLFLNSSPPPDVLAGVKGRADEDIVPAGREVFIHYPSGMGRSKLRWPGLADGTQRNLNTVARLAGMAGAP
jgi:uncharacterized protein (DUF1697 family)